MSTYEFIQQFHSGAFHGSKVSALSVRYLACSQLGSEQTVTVRITEGVLDLALGIFAACRDQRRWDGGTRGWHSLTFTD